MPATPTQHHPENDPTVPADASQVIVDAAAAARVAALEQKFERLIYCLRTQGTFDFRR